MTNCASSEDGSEVMGVRGSLIPLVVKAILASSVLNLLSREDPSDCCTALREGLVGATGPGGGFRSPARVSRVSAVRPATPAAARTARRRREDLSRAGR